MTGWMRSAGKRVDNRSFFGCDKMCVEGWYMGQEYENFGQVCEDTVDRYEEMVHGFRTGTPFMSIFC